ncbi:NIPSNAP family protein [Sporosarcina sp. Te-1]|uniref:NIPSNAP family protein n=1 Tax=Sporosarcina sp. Te-1 TaxID=2818390 RepID=UPI001A9E9984|nr:NIPSNAP family protein [Sporosarcina sp. Te-1]QTD42985.1 NIPSNAP family protein [Sporosarcina sp. Te-1]
MFYRRKQYIVKNEFVEELNTHFTTTNLPNQLEHGSKLIGRWMLPHDEETTEIFAIWEYESYEAYREIEAKIRADQEHVSRIMEWYEKNGGRDYVLRHYLVEVKDEQLLPTVEDK